MNQTALQGRPAVAWPEFALSIRQPWAWLIVNGYKNLENRTRSTRFRGPILIHAGKTMTKDDWRAAVIPAIHAQAFLPAPDDLARGGFVGMATVVDCITASPSPWFAGPYAFVLEDAQPLPFRPAKGALGFFRPQEPRDE